MSILAQLVIAALIFAVGAAGGIRWHAGQDAIAENKRQQQEAKEAAIRLQRVDTAAVGHEGDKARIRTEFLVITEKVEHALQSDFYAAGQPACLDDSGLRAVAEAAGATDPAGEPARAVPRPAAPD